MNRFTKYVSSQFKNPRGFGGVIISIIQNVLNRAMYNDAATIVSLKHDDRVLDIGYGNGYLLQILYKKQVVDLYGIDISDDAKKMATKKNKKAFRDNHLHLSVGDCCSLPYEESTFDAVTSINTIYFWNDTVKGLSEIRRTLKNGKSFYNIVYTKEYTMDFEVTPHQLRHTYITNLLYAGVDPKTVQYLAGHENSKTTMDIYAKVKYNRPEELIGVVNRALT